MTTLQNANMQGNYNTGLPVMQPEGSKKKIIFIISGILLFFLILLLFVLFFIKNKQTASKGNVTLTYWGIWEDKSVFSEVIQDFEKKYPNIKVKYEQQNPKNLGQYIDRLSARIKNGNGPDVYRFHNSWVFQIRPLLAPLPNSVLEATQFKEQYYDVIQKDMYSNGAYYGIPLGIDTLALFVNDEKFTQGQVPPANWDDLDKISRELTIINQNTGKIESSGVSLGTYDNIAHASDIISLLFVLNGADLTNLAGPQKMNAVQALEFYTSFAQGANARWNSELENSKLAFAQGKVALYFGYSWDILEIKALNPSLSFRIMPVPRLADRNQTIASYWAEGVSLTSKNQKEAFLFLQFISQKESLEKIFAAQSRQRLIGVAYPRRDMASLLKSNEWLAPIVAQAPNAVSTIFSSDTYDAGSITVLNTYLQNAVNGVLNNGSSETSISTLSQGVSQIYK